MRERPLRGGVCRDGACEADADCLVDEICLTGGCAPADGFACQPGQAPVAFVDPVALDFGTVTLGDAVVAVVIVQNNGDCLLGVSGASLDDAGGTFSCPACAPETLPAHIAPGREREFAITFSPASDGEVLGALFLDVDDPLVAPGVAVSLRGIGVPGP